MIEAVENPSAIPPDPDKPIKAEIILYQFDHANVPVEVRYLNETFWLTQKEMAELFDVNVPAISKYLSNIFSEGELGERSTISNLEIVETEGKRNIKHTVALYNLDAIIAIDLPRPTEQEKAHPRSTLHLAPTSLVSAPAS